MSPSRGTNSHSDQVSDEVKPIQIFIQPLLQSLSPHAILPSRLAWSYLHGGHLPLVWKINSG